MSTDLRQWARETASTLTQLAWLDLEHEVMQARVEKRTLPPKARALLAYRAEAADSLDHYARIIIEERFAAPWYDVRGRVMWPAKARKALLRFGLMVPDQPGDKRTPFGRAVARALKGDTR